MKKGLLETVLTILFIICIAVVLILISAGVLMLGWELFAVPVFGLKSLTLLQGVGLTVLLAGVGFRGGHN